MDRSLQESQALERGRPHTPSQSRASIATNAARANPACQPAAAAPAVSVSPEQQLGTGALVSRAQPRCAVLCHAVLCRARERCPGAAQAMLTHLLCRCSLPLPRGSADHPLPEEQLIQEWLFGRVPVPVPSAHAVTGRLVPTPTCTTRPPHPPPLLPSPITSGFSFASVLRSFFFSFFFFLPILFLWKRD